MKHQNIYYKNYSLFLYIYTVKLQNYQGEKYQLQISINCLDSFAIMIKNNNENDTS